MKTITSGAKRFITGIMLGSGITGLNLSAQPVVSYTVSGTSHNYTLDFTLNNSTPGTEGFDIYYFGVLVNGTVSGHPSGYASDSFSQIHQVEVDGPAANWQFNDYWIDASYTHLPTGSNRSGFEIHDTDATAPTSVSYFAMGTPYADSSATPYTGPGNEDANVPSNPLFTGYAVAAVPEPGTLGLMAAGAVAVMWRVKGIKKVRG